MSLSKLKSYLKVSSENQDETVPGNNEKDFEVGRTESGEDTTGEQVPATNNGAQAGQNIPGADSVESEDTEVDEEIEAMGDEAADLEACAVKLDELSNDSEVSNEAAGEFIEIAESLESICEFIEISQENGGLDAFSATAINLAVEHQYKRLGVAAPETPALESLEDADARLAYSSEAMEGVKDTLKKIWEAIKKAVNKAIEAVKNFFKALFSSVEKIKKKSKALEAKIKDIEGKNPSETTFTAGSLYPLWSWKSNTGAKATVDGLNDIADTSKALLDNYGKTCVHFYKSLSKFITDASAGKVIITFDDENGEVAKNIVAAIGAFENKEVFGGMQFKVNYTAEVVNRMLPRLEKVKGEGAKDLNMAVLSLKEMRDILSSVDKVVGILEGKKKLHEEINKAREEAVKRADEFVKNAEGRLKGIIKKPLVRSTMRAMQTDMIRPINQFTAHAYRMLKLALAYVEKSMSYYK